MQFIVIFNADGHKQDKCFDIVISRSSLISRKEHLILSYWSDRKDHFEVK